MCFVRKALDYVFTRHELKWLDDIMPESHKREKEEKKKKLLEYQEDDPKEVWFSTLPTHFINEFPNSTFVQMALRMWL